MRSIGVLIAIAWVADGLIDFYSFPVGIQFVSNYHRQGSTNHRTHLRTMRHNIHRAISVDSYKGVRVQRGTIGIRSAGCVVVVPQNFG